MYERHENEQYFFDEATLERLATFVRGFESPCLICAPLLGRRVAESGHPVRVLDIDERFSQVPGFRHFDLQRPEWLGEEYDLILCDPPFYNVSLARLFAGLRVLARNDFRQPLVVSYLSRRANAVLGTFGPFGIERPGIRVGYQTVQPTERNEIELFTNLPREMLGALIEESGEA